MAITGRPKLCSKCLRTCFEYSICSGKPKGLPLASHLALLDFENRPDSGRSNLAGPRIVTGPACWPAPDQAVAPRTLAQEIGIHVGVRSRVGLEQQRPLLIRLIAR